MSHQIGAWLATLGGLPLFGAAYWIHQRLRLSRFACVLAALAGFMTYAAVIGSWVNGIAAQVGIVAAIGVIVLGAVIVADVKGKKKGADRPALFAFFLLPIFLVAGLTAMPALFQQASSGFQKSTTNISTQVGR